MRNMRFVRWLLLPAAVLFCGLASASAQGVDVRQACTPDAMRLCSEFIPDAGRVKSCMLRKRRELSETCLSAMRGGGGRHGGRGYHYHHHYRHHRG